ncbi:epoxide hydrolase 1-like [Lytechinus pictus]|uniref:epoxide hydrolase 1-like n=1 Tax=Lytechinus pictus TaxID=7653 RepID=UPI0030B9E818
MSLRTLLSYPIIRYILLLPLFILTTLIGILFLLGALIFKGPSWVFRKKKTGYVRPECLDEPSLGTHKVISLKDIKLHIVESGDPKNPLMLFLHGFPECWYSWRHQIRTFNKDYHCVAFDMRGVGESDGPDGVSNYTMDKLVGDVHDMIKTLGHKSCVLVGHDWGGLIGWEFAARYPDMVDNYIPMNVPHPDRFADFITSSVVQIMLSWYMLFFQLPYLPEILMSMGDYGMLKEAYKIGPNTDEDAEAFKYSISMPGRSTTFVNYYRNIIGAIFNQPCGKVSVPTLLIWGTGDAAFNIKLSHDTEKYCPKIIVKRIEGGHHSIQQEQPDVVNNFLKQYLNN